jgi:hypothetical protein
MDLSKIDDEEVLAKMVSNLDTGNLNRFMTEIPKCRPGQLEEISTDDLDRRKNVRARLLQVKKETRCKCGFKDGRRSDASI